MDVPTATLPTAEEKDAARIASQFGRAMKRRPAADYGMTERQLDRAEQRSRSRRQQRINARRQEEHRRRQRALETLQAQIRVASGELDCSPALVENARRALEARVARVMAEYDDLTEEQAVELVYSAAVGQ